MDFVWSCQPNTSSLCLELEASFRAAGSKSFNATLSKAAVERAATNSSFVGSAIHTVLVQVVDENGEVRIWDSAAINFVQAEASLVPIDVGGPRVFTPVDTYVTVAAKIFTCVDEALAVSWAWRLPLGNWSESSEPFFGPRLREPVSTFGDGEPGTYEIRLELVGIPAEALFEIIIGPVPAPEAVLRAPETADPSCDFVLDATGSTDPQGSRELFPLSFDWQCDEAEVGAVSGADVATCRALAGNATGTDGLLTIPGGTLAEGRYRFSIVASRSGDDANSTADVVVEVAESNSSSPRPAVTLLQPAEAVSPLLPLSISASITQSGGCVTPPRKTWWIYNDTNSEWLNSASATGSAANYIVPAPLPVVPGQYKLRLVLSDSELPLGLPWTAACAGEAHCFDSAAFIVGRPPAGGECHVYPASGTVLETSFIIFTDGWEDVDYPPLKYRFSWTEPAAGGNSWMELAPWSVSTSFDNAMFGKTGVLTLRAGAKDLLGSISHATLDLEVFAPAVAMSEADLVNMLNRTSNGGAPFETLNAASAVADTLKSNRDNSGSSGSATSPSTANTILDFIEGSGALSEPSDDTMEVMTSVLGSVIEAAAPVAPAPGAATSAAEVVDLSVASKAAGVAGAIAKAAASMDSGLQTGTAGSLVGAISTLFSAVTIEAAPAPSPGTTVFNATEAAEAAKEAKKQQAEVSGALRGATGNIADAVMKGSAVGETVVVDGGSGLKMNLQKVDSTALETIGATVGSFTLPGLGAHVGRRLSEACEDSTGFFGLQETKWPSNPYGYAGRGGSANITMPEFPNQNRKVKRGVKLLTVPTPECCDVDDQSVTSMDVRFCGEIQEVHDLPEPVKFALPITSKRPETKSFVEARLCQYFNETSQTWTDEGCSLEMAEDGVVKCQCNHLSAFGAAFGAIHLSFLEVFDCSNANVVSMESINKLIHGEWQPGRAWVAVWAMILLVTYVWGMLICGMKTFEQEFNVKRDEFVEMQMVATSAEVNEMRSRELERTSSKLTNGEKEDEDKDNGVWANVRKSIMLNGIMQGSAGAIGLDAAPAPAIGTTKQRKQAVKDRMEKAAERHQKPVIVAKAAAWFQCNILQVYVPPMEEVMMKSLASGVVIGLSVKYIKSHTTCLMGLRNIDSKKLVEMHQRSQSGLNVTTKLSEQQKEVSGLAHQYSATLERVRLAIMESAADEVAKSYWHSFKVCHPLMQYLQPSITFRVSVQVVALAVQIFGEMAFAALFFSNSSSSKGPDTADSCDSTSFWGRVYMDVRISILSSLLTLGPFLIIVKVHERPRPILQDGQERAKTMRLRFVQDVILITCGLCYVAFAIFFTMCFLVNISPKDQDHWLVSVIMFLVKDWLLLPLFLVVVHRLIIVGTVRRSRRLRHLANKVMNNMFIEAQTGHSPSSVAGQSGRHRLSTTATLKQADIWGSGESDVDVPPVAEAAKLQQTANYWRTSTSRSFGRVSTLNLDQEPKAKGQAPEALTEAAVADLPGCAPLEEDRHDCWQQRTAATVGSAPLEEEVKRCSVTTILPGQQEVDLRSVAAAPNEEIRDREFDVTLEHWRANQSNLREAIQKGSQEALSDSKLPTSVRVVTAKGSKCSAGWPIAEVDSGLAQVRGPDFPVRVTLVMQDMQELNLRSAAAAPNEETIIADIDPPHSFRTANFDGDMTFGRGGSPELIKEAAGRFLIPPEPDNSLFLSATPPPEGLREAADCGLHAEAEDSLWMACGSSRQELSRAMDGLQNHSATKDREVEEFISGEMEERHVARFGAAAADDPEERAEIDELLAATLDENKEVLSGATTVVCPVRGRTA